MKYKVLDQAKAREVLDRMDPPNNERPGLIGLESYAGAGELLEEALVDELRQKLLTLRNRYSENTKAFDAEACVVMHQSLPNEEPDLLSDDGFWRWLALGPLQEIVLWRFPAGKGRAPEEGEAPPKLNRPNFGIGPSARQRSECYPYKLWLRAELGSASEGDDPYRYAKRGDVDFWTSHVLRQTYTTNRTLCAALVRFQYPDERGGRPLLIPGTERVDKGRTGIRTLAKRIRRLQASVELTVLEDGELHTLISDLAKDLMRAN